MVATGSEQRSDHNRVPGTREEVWSRLEALLTRAGPGGLSSLSDAEVEDIGRLYRAATTHLALLRTFGASARQVERLNALVSRAHSVIYGRTRQGKNLSVYLWSFLGFPETVRHTGRYHVVATLLLILGGVYGFQGAQRDPEWVLEFVFPGDERTPYATTDELRATLLHGRPVEADVGDDSQTRRSMGSAEKAHFAAFLWQHNTKVALVAFFAGSLLALPTILSLIYNGVFLGVYSYTFHSHGLAREWWAWILPHGVTELLAVVLLAGGGLFVGHILIAPGEVGRLEALRRERPHLVRLVLFAFPMLLLAALIESFVRQSGLSDTGRYIFAAVSAVLWIAYLGFARIPEHVRERARARQTTAERVVPLPVDEELLGAVRPRRRA